MKNTDTRTPREANDPVADLSRGWAERIAARIETEAGAHAQIAPWSPYTGRPVPGDDRLGAMVEYDAHTGGPDQARTVRIWVYVAATAIRDGARELRVQVYGKNTGGVRRVFRAPAEDGPELSALLERVGGWAAREARTVAAQIKN
ncbi:hypothetical protein KDK95_33250 [Actinospica sp. MGRD01-02]|uniref:Uncharacterized protein n=1 Tax=Actinospica acidithermotolerans TaxID=2828514 RepID=A0A941IQA4_9ACTN|nr:hypothetical protein [Actinospica acidithermotolerans]MBR7831221.1 hypothetical protein [Actinospica acidithermotolerans]